VAYRLLVAILTLAVWLVAPPAFAEPEPRWTEERLAQMLAGSDALEACIQSSRNTLTMFFENRAFPENLPNLECGCQAEVLGAQFREIAPGQESIQRHLLQLSLHPALKAELTPPSDGTFWTSLEALAEDENFAERFGFEPEEMSNALSSLPEVAGKLQSQAGAEALGKSIPTCVALQDAYQSIYPAFVPWSGSDGVVFAMAESMLREDPNVHLSEVDWLLSQADPDAECRPVLQGVIYAWHGGTSPADSATVNLICTSTMGMVDKQLPELSLSQRQQVKRFVVTDFYVAAASTEHARRALEDYAKTRWRALQIDALSFSETQAARDSLDWKHLRAAAAMQVPPVCQAPQDWREYVDI